MTAGALRVFTPGHPMLLEMELVQNKVTWENHAPLHTFDLPTFSQPFLPMKHMHTVPADPALPLPPPAPPFSRLHEILWEFRAGPRRDTIAAKL